ncbi:hypothetical protein L207DRAFT_523118 [Hyaloscypha variabilis F]|uniref:Uncharacterized protein n=1 Tax=Hyaloscypha variabilis (strain UAMH 11265 / GT02V1 / F) TaxID=1149755 RepID=A0A2J6SAH6_HYAVF|nr:hypothetical protein L207DRAFT_523118 [Hyaloscypha variabilis F]
MEVPSLPSVEQRLVGAIFDDMRNDQFISTDHTLADRESHTSTSSQAIQSNPGEILMPTTFACQAIYSSTPSITNPRTSGHDNKSFRSLIHEISEIRANTQISPFGPGTIPTLQEPRPNSAPKSPVSQHPLFAPSSKIHQSPSPVIETPLSNEYVLLRDFINDLPLGSPTPFKSELFVESPEQKRKWVQRPVTTREGAAKMPVEVALVYDEAPKHRANCILRCSRPFPQGQHTNEALLSIWTRKYPAGWQGLYKNAGELVNFDEPQGTVVWLFSVAAVVEIDGVETSLECGIPKKVLEFSGMSFELEPAWEDVVHVLKEEISGRIQRGCAVQPPMVTQQSSSIQTSSQQALPQQAPPQQALLQQSLLKQPLLQQPLLGLSLHQLATCQPTMPPQMFPQAPAPPKNSSQRARKTPKKSEDQQNSQPAQSKPPQYAPMDSQDKSFVPCIMPNYMPCTMGNRTIASQYPEPSVGSQHISQSPYGSPGSDLVYDLSQGFNVPTAIFEGGGCEKSSYDNKDPPVVYKALQGDALSATVVEEPHLDASPVQEQLKSKRKRAPAKKKQVAPIQEGQEASGQIEQAATLQTPPSTEKSGRKRKNSTTEPTPAKKRAPAKKSAMNTPASDTPAEETNAEDTTSVKPPASKRVRKTKPPASSSNVQHENSKEGEIKATAGDKVPQQPAQARSPPCSPPAGFEVPRMGLNQQNHDQVQQMGLNQRNHDQGQQMGLNQPSDDKGQQMRQNELAHNDEFTTSSINQTVQTQMPMLAWNNQQLPGSFHPSTTLGANPPYLQDIWNRISVIDGEIGYHLNNRPLVSNNPEAWRGIQSRIDMLVRERSAWSAIVPNYSYQMYSPAWNTGMPSNVGIFPMQSTGDQLQPNNQIFSVQQSSGFYPGGFQTPMQHGYNNFGESSALNASFNQPTISGTPQIAQAIQGYAASSPALLTLAEWPQEDVLRARTSVESTLGRPLGPSISNYQSS